MYALQQVTAVHGLWIDTVRKKKLTQNREAKKETENRG